MFEPGETIKTIPIRLAADAQAEATEAFRRRNCAIR